VTNLVVREAAGLREEVVFLAVRPLTIAVHFTGS
jgi:hypothetical protein